MTGRSPRIMHGDRGDWYGADRDEEIAHFSPHTKIQTITTVDPEATQYNSCKDGLGRELENPLNAEVGKGSLNSRDSLGILNNFTSYNYKNDCEGQPLNKHLDTAYEKDKLKDLKEKAEDLIKEVDVDLNKRLANETSQDYWASYGPCQDVTDDELAESKKALDANTSKKGKLPIAEVHPWMLEELAKVSQMSKEKGYEVLSWIKPEFNGKFLEYLASAADRHAIAFKSGADLNQELKMNGDPVETLVYHTSQAAYNYLMISVLLRMGRNDLDDRKIKI